MISKESLADKVGKVARLIPGFSAYQDKEKLRDIDKRLRNQLAFALDKERARVDEIKRLLAKKLNLDPLDDLDRLTRKMHRLADTVKFAAYGYAPLFDQASMDKKGLEELFNFDQSLEEKLAKIEGKVDKLVSAPETELTVKIREVDLSLGELEDKLNEREKFLKQVK